MTHPYLEGGAPSPKKGITAFTCELLCEVVYWEDKSKEPSPDNRVGFRHPKRRSVGRTYAEIAEMVKAEYPEAKTSPTAVRRIAGRIRAEEPGYDHYLMPNRRPRAGSK